MHENDDAKNADFRNQALNAGSDTEMPGHGVAPAPYKIETSNEASKAIADHFASKGLYVGADGDIRLNEPMAGSAADIATVCVVQAPTPAQIIDDLLLDGTPYLPSILKAAVRQVVRQGAKERKAELVTSVSTQIGEADQVARAFEHLMQFVKSAFEGDADINAAVVQHFIYQVKRKLANLPVSDHLMPVFVSTQQGVGKTRAVQKLLSPLSELAKSVLFSDIADRRSIYVFRHPVLVLDDMERLSKNEIQIVKNRITGEDVVGRAMMSNWDIGTRQRATFIGTANESVTALVPDQTGHRRFFELTFRNANPASGGDPGIWDVINATDFLAIWRAVDPFAPSPLQAFRGKIFNNTSAPRPKSKVHAWALEVDPADPQWDGAHRQGNDAVGAMDLYNAYCEQCQDAWMSVKEFATLMREATIDPNVPFLLPKRTSKGWYYRFRRRS